MRQLSFVLPVLLLAAPASAQDAPLTLEATTRARVETFRGQPRSTGPDGDTAVLFRTELRVAYDAGPIAFGGELVDSRAYLDDRDTLLTTSETDPVEPSQLWLRLDLAPRTTVQLGRLNLDLGSRRLLARNGYRNTINSFTGARLDLPTAKDGSLTLFWTMPHNRRPDDADGLRENRVVLDRERDELQLFGAYLGNHPTPLGRLDLYALGLAERDAPGYLTRNRRLGTVGARLRRRPAKARWDYDAEGTWQFGRAHAFNGVADRVDRDVAAGLVQLIAGYTLPSAWSPRIAASFDYASGEGRGSRIGRFDSLYGARTFDFGPTSLYGPVSRANLVSPSLRVEVTPGRRWQAHAAARPLWLASRTDSFGMTGVRDPSGRSGRFAGVQYDSRVQYWIRPGQVRAGLWFAWLDKGRFLRDAPNAVHDGDTLYGATELMLSF